MRFFGGGALQLELQPWAQAACGVMTPRLDQVKPLGRGDRGSVDVLRPTCWPRWPLDGDGGGGAARAGTLRGTRGSSRRTGSPHAQPGRRQSPARPESQPRARPCRCLASTLDRVCVGRRRGRGWFPPLAPRPLPRTRSPPPRRPPPRVNAAVKREPLALSAAADVAPRAQPRTVRVQRPGPGDTRHIHREDPVTTSRRRTKRVMNLTVFSLTRQSFDRRVPGVQT